MRKTPFLRLTALLILGIITNEFFQINLKYLFVGLITTIILCISSILLRKKTNQALSFGLIIAFLVFLLGVFIHHYGDERRHQSHFSHFLENHNVQFTGEIIESSHTKLGWNYYLYMQVMMNQIDSIPLRVKGKVLLSTNQKFKKGDVIQVRGECEPIKKVSGIHGLDYHKFLSRKQIHYRIVSDDVILIKANSSFWLEMRESLMFLIDNSSFNINSKNLAKAMLFGDKSNIGELNEIFRKTGTSHVLAISGLHVGVIAAIFFFLFSWLPEKYNAVKFSIVLLSVWSFCLISGMAASTLRACIMLSFYLVGKLINRANYAKNFCLASAFLLILFHPGMVFEIGFQFSFLAVLGILYLYPPMVKVIAVKQPFHGLWNMTMLSLTAQIMITPLSLYYFNEFPLLFALCSMFAVPFTGILISMYLINMGLMLCGISLSFIVSITDWIGEMMISLLRIFADLEYFQLRNLCPSELEIVVYFMALFILITSFKKSSGFLYSGFGLTFLFLLVLQLPINKRLTEEYLVFYQHNKAINFDLIHRGNALCFEEYRNSNDFKRKGEHAYSRIRNIKRQFINRDINECYQIGKRSIMIINNFKDPLPGSKCDVLLVNTFWDGITPLPKAEYILDYTTNENLNDIEWPNDSVLRVNIN